MKRLSLVLLALSALTVAGCRGSARTVLSPQADLTKIQRVVVMPFTDDPFVPGSGLKASAFFRKAVQTKITGVHWIGPTEVLKEEGIAVGSALNEDTVMDAPGAIEPILGRIFTSTETAVPAISPGRYTAIAERHQADAVVYGSVFYDPGTGQVEGMVTQRRPREAGIAIQVADARTGKVLLAFRQSPKETQDRVTVNQLLRETAEGAAGNIQRSWK